MPKTILIVDDEPEVLNAVSAIVESEGYSVAKAENGERALELLAATSFDLVLTDLMMPGITGWQVLDKVKAQYPGTRVVVFTGYIDDQGEKLLLDRKADGFLTKPIDIPELQGLLGSLLQDSVLVGASVVAVDDLRVTLNMVERILADDGVAVYGFQTAAEAYGYALTEPPHCFVLDLEMPEVNGFELGERIRASDELKHIPIIILTSHSDRETVMKALELGVQGFVVKPFEPEALSEKVRQVIAGAHRA